MSYSDNPVNNFDATHFSIELEKYKAVFNESLDAIIITDGETGKIIDANNACSNILGYFREELIGRHYLLLFDNSPTSEIPTFENVQMFGPVVTAKNIKAKNGNIIPMDLTISTMEFDKHNFVLSTFRDARERIKYETEIQKYSEELRELNTSKDKFFSIIAHDLKSPLTAVMGYSEILSQDIDDISKDDIVSYSASINRVAKELAELLDNLLNWSRIQTGRMEFEPVKLNLHNLVNNTFRLLTSSAKLKEVQLINNVDKEFMILADENMMSTILRNFVSNSIKFTEKGKIAISASKATNKAEINIMDTGIGMDKEIINRLFKIETTKSRNGTQNERGTGLGLILCNEFIKKHDGTITVNSEVGKGSSFTITLPYK